MQFAIKLQWPRPNLILILLVSVLLFSCSSSDNPLAPNDEPPAPEVPAIRGEAIPINEQSSYLPGEEIRFEVRDFTLSGDRFEVRFNNETTIDLIRIPGEQNRLIGWLPPLPSGSSSLQFTFIDTSKIWSFNVGEYTPISNAEDYVQEYVDELQRAMQQADLTASELEQAEEKLSEVRHSLEAASAEERTFAAYILRNYLGFDDENNAAQKSFFAHSHTSYRFNSCSEAGDELVRQRTRLTGIATLTLASAYLITAPELVSTIAGGVLGAFTIIKYKKDIRAIPSLLSAIYDACWVNIRFTEVLGIDEIQDRYNEMRFFDKAIADAESRYLFDVGVEREFGVIVGYSLLEEARQLLNDLDEALEKLKTYLPDAWFEGTERRDENEVNLVLLPADAFRLEDVSDERVLGAIRNEVNRFGLTFTVAETAPPSGPIDFSMRIVNEELGLDATLLASLDPDNPPVDGALWPQPTFTQGLGYDWQAIGLHVWDMPADMPYPRDELRFRWSVRGSDRAAYDQIQMTTDGSTNERALAMYQHARGGGIQGQADASSLQKTTDSFPFPDNDLNVYWLGKYKSNFVPGHDYEDDYNNPAIFVLTETIRVDQAGRAVSKNWTVTVCFVPLPRFDPEYYDVHRSLFCGSQYTVN